MSKLYIVSTPIGNLDDITLRAINTLKSVEYIACEDTRKSGVFLKKLGIENKKLLSYYEENEIGRIPEIISILQNDVNVALISNAGTPAISDPGYKLIKECLKNLIPVIAIPGPSAILTALISSGLPTDKFLYLGFPPQKKGKRLHFIEKYKDYDSTFILYESPYRIIDTLIDIEKVFSNCDATVCRELTKIYEEIQRGKIPELIAYFKKNKPRGEFTIVIHPVSNENKNNY